ncbi:polysaccharide deacetylase family protein [Photobacterium sp. Ph5]|nr:polysaccharide deacetylase family protein [Photobacterium sp. Ph6]MCG3876336.1 polysaccharide deacetylase family protein [Photobacterium sp. Ph5]
MYHYVREIKDSRYPDIKGMEVEDFIKQISFFLENYNIVKMEDVVACSNGILELPVNALLLTFDDGYAEHFNYVYPILKEMNIQGSFFVPVKPVIENELLDVNKIHFILASINNINHLVSDIKSDIELYKNKYHLKSFDEYFSEWAISNRFDNKEVIFIKRMLQHVLPEELRNTLSSKYFSKYVKINEKSFAKELYMNTYQLKQLIRDGMHVGCHGYDHYCWNKLDEKSLQVEIMKSKEFLLSLGCNMQKWTACYPYGSFSDDVASELLVQNCKLAFTTEVKMVDIDNDNKLLYARLDANDFPPKSDNYKKYLNG